MTEVLLLFEVKLLNNCLLLAGVVTERVQEAHKDKSAPMMMLFPGKDSNYLYIILFYFSLVYAAYCIDCFGII